MKKIALFFFTMLLASTGFAQLCQADFTVSVSGNTATFVNNSTGLSPGAIYNWSFDDGNVSGASDPTHTYNSPGYYVVCLTVSDSSSNCTSTYCDTAIINAPIPCNANFNAYPDSINSGTVYFYNTSSGGSTYLWDFNDGTTSTQQHPNHTFSGPGPWFACLTVSSATCTETYCDTIFPYTPTPCVAGFSTSLVGGGTYSFNNASQGGGWYFWSFGDGNTSTLGSPTHTYGQNGVYDVCLVTTTAAGCVDTSCVSISVGGVSNTCTADFSWSVASYGSQNIIFQNNSVGTTDYFWDFGNGETATYSFSSFNRVYLQSGNYNVCLIAYNPATGCSDTTCQVVPVTVPTPGPCDASFVSYEDTGAVAGLVHFTNLSGPGTSYSWDFGDGTTSNIFNPSHTFNGPGPFEVCVTVMDTGLNCGGTFCDSVFITNSNNNSPCAASFNWSVSPWASSNIVFNNNSYGTTNYLWDFGDGTSTTTSLPQFTHPYAQSGAYDVCLYSYNQANGCSDTVCQTIQVTVPVINCYASFTSYEDSTVAGMVYFSDQSLNGANHYWTFGDGTSSSAVNPSHQFNGVGPYVVCLTISDSFCTDTQCDTLFFTSNTSCLASFNYNVPSPTTAQVNFYNNSIGGSQFSWDFGDGNYSNSASSQVSHVYNTGGTYDVCLYSWNPATGCSDTTCQSVTVIVNTPCDAQFYAYEDSLAGGLVYFSSSSNWTLDHVWDFGDGDTSHNYSPIHQYNGVGPYVVCLTVFDSTCSDTYCDTLYFNNGGSCSASFSSNPSAFDPSTVFFNNTSAGGSDYLWDFGDGNTSTSSWAQHTYAQDGTYNVCLTVSNPATGCSDVTCQSVTITSGCNASFFWFEDTVNNDVIFCVNNSTGSNLSYLWDFGDGNTANTAYPTHTYASAGVYDVCLTVSDSSGCSDTYCDSIFAVARQEGFTINVIAPQTVGVEETDNQPLQLNGLYPNPAAEQATFDFDSKVQATAQLTITNNLGQVVDVRSITVLPGNNLVQLETATLSKGLYFVQLRADAQNVHLIERLVKR